MIQNSSFLGLRISQISTGILIGVGCVMLTYALFLVREAQVVTIVDFVAIVFNFFSMLFDRYSNTKL